MNSDEPQKIVILNFQSGAVLILDYDSNIYDDPEEFFAQEDMSDHSINDCHYMIVTAKDLVISFTPD